jgi:GIY-YIG catalytic domain
VYDELAFARLRGIMFPEWFDSELWRPSGLACRFDALCPDPFRKPRNCAIYAIHDPSKVDPFGHTDGPIFYIGQTVNCRRRISRHIRDIGRGRRISRKCRYMRDLLLRDVVARFDLLGVAPAGDAADASEDFWIAHAQAIGYVLTNSSRYGGPE